MAQHFSDTELTAFLNGALDEARAEELVIALETESELAERLEKLDPLAAEIRDAFEPVLTMPVPERLSEAVRKGPDENTGNNVVSFAAAKVKRESKRYGWIEFGAVAASLAIGLVVGGQSGLFWPAASSDNAIVVASNEGPAVAPQVATFLASKGSGETQQIAGLGLARASISFRDTENRFCRQFSIESSETATDGVACARDGSWAVAAIGTHAIEGGDIRTASGDASPAVLAAVDMMIAGDPLDADAEKAALKKMAR